MPPYYCVCPETGVSIYWVFGALLFGICLPALVNGLNFKHLEYVRLLFFGGASLCIIWGCANVLDTPYSTIEGVKTEL